MSRTEDDYERYWQARQVKSLIAEAEAELANITDREARRQNILAEHGFDIGTREEAVTQTGPYADQANTDRIAVFYMEHRVGNITLTEES